MADVARNYEPVEHEPTRTKLSPQKGCSFSARSWWSVHLSTRAKRDVTKRRCD